MDEEGELLLLSSLLLSILLAPSLVTKQFRCLFYESICTKMDLILSAVIRNDSISIIYCKHLIAPLQESFPRFEPGECLRVLSGKGNLPFPLPDSFPHSDHLR